MEHEELVRKILEAADRVGPMVPDVDPTDLIHIVEMYVRPFGSGLTFFQREARPGCHVL